MTAWRSSSLLVLVLAFGVLFSLLYVSSFLSLSFSIPTKPRVSEEEAVKIVQDHLKHRLVGFKDLGIYMGNGAGYKTYSEFQARNVHLPLIYTHQNGTLYYINPTTHEIERKCTNTAKTVCNYSENFVNESRGRLVYAIDSSLETSLPEGRCSLPDFFIIDAMSGDILFSFIDNKPESIPRQCLINSIGG